MGWAACRHTLGRRATIFYLPQADVRSRLPYQTFTRVLARFEARALLPGIGLWELFSAVAVSPRWAHLPLLPRLTAGSVAPGGVLQTP